MNSKLLQFIADQTSQLDAEEAALRERLRVISQEREGLRKAHLAATKQAGTIYSGRLTDRSAPKTIRQNTIMARVMEVLEEYPRGLIALDVLRILNAKRDSPLLRESLSPQLSRLKQAGFIELEGSEWKITRADWRTPNDLFSDVDQGPTSHTVGPSPKSTEATDAAPDKDASAASLIAPAKGR